MIYLENGWEITVKNINKNKKRLKGKNISFNDLLTKWLNRLKNNVKY